MIGPSDAVLIGVATIWKPTWDVMSKTEALPEVVLNSLQCLMIVMEKILVSG